MNAKREDIEIMAPVGSYESLMAAIQAGANSVYFGVELLNMRARSSVNFTLDDLKQIVDICKENSIRSYLTVNTIIYDEDILYMKKIVEAAKKNNISAIIATDMATINYASAIGVEIHMSTQVNITNIESVKYYSQFADVMVLARELNLKQIKYITKQIKAQNIQGPSGNPVQIEIFTHGALCMAISGKCYLSLHENNASANRGACLQTCRKAYIVTEKETGDQLEIDNEYIMSPKDLCTISFVDKILEAGVKIFKIEGRARPPEYVKTVVKAYRKAIDANYTGTYSRDKIAGWEQQLKSVFNRGFWDGYYLGRKLGEWSKIYGSKATKYKSYVGKTNNYFSKLKVGEFKIEAGELSVGDEILIIGPTSGVIETIVKEIRKDLKGTKIAKKGDVVSIPVSEKIRRADKLYKLMFKEDNLV